jgi:hypothetical protein
MKKTILLIPALFFAMFLLKAQQTPAVQIAQKIAQKMQDTLSISPQQRQQIFQINIQLNDLKQAVRQQTSNRDSLQRGFQRIERGRDSLYHTVLSDEKYQLYIQKKRNLVNNNQ